MHFNEIIASIFRLDRILFEWSMIYLNQKWLTEFCIEFAKVKYLFLCFFFLLFFYFLKNKKESLLFLFYAVLLMIISELSVSMLKSFLGRLRPGVATGLYLKIDAYSMPSAHAWNSMTLFVFIGLWFRRFLYTLVMLSIFIGLARFLSNNHFLLDVILGWLGGALLGSLFFRCLLLLDRGSKRHNFLGLPRYVPQK